MNGLLLNEGDSIDNSPLQPPARSANVAFGTSLRVSIAIIFSDIPETQRPSAVIGDVEGRKLHLTCYDDAIGF